MATEPRSTAQAGDRHDDGHDALGGETPVQRGGFRDKMRRNPATRGLWRGAVFVVGLLCIAGGFALVVLPGPLTIPPIVLGLWIWSTEFAWADRFFAPAKEKGKEAWEHAQRHPVSSSIITGGGLVLAAVLIWAAIHFDVVSRAKDMVGLS